MKMNKKIIRLKRYTKLLFHCERSVAILLALALVLSFSLVTAVPAAAVGGVWYVDVDTPAADEAQDGTTWDTAFDTIGEGVSAAGTGAIINVAAGTYKPEPVDDIGINIDKDDLTLKAVGATEDTIIDFSLCDLSIRIIQVDKATVEGFTMKGGGLGHHAFQVIGLQENPVSNVNILNNVITGTTNAAISLYGAWGTGNGITVSGNTIDKCQYGIYVGAGLSNCTISNNTITNSIQVNSDWGALTFCGPISGLTISGNEISSNEKLNGIVLGYGGSDFTDIAVENNTISNNLGGVLIGDVTIFTNLVINYNNIVGNDTGVSNESTTEVDATNNWWGDASGPTHSSNLGGAGDKVSDNVDFIPFLGSSGGVVDNKVSITKSGPTSANSGVDITYTITYKNIGTDYATNIIITETYPSEVEFVSANPEPDIGNNQWTIDTLAPGEGDTIYVTVHIK